jgi:hypothetical protein
MHFGYSRPHQSSNAPDQERGDAGRAASDAETTDLRDSTQRGGAAGAELPPQITEWMRRKKRKRRVDILRNSVSWAITLTVTGGIITVTVLLLPERSAVLELWHEQAQRALEAMEQPKTIELTADEQITVPIPKAVSRRRWSNL